MRWGIDLRAGSWQEVLRLTAANASRGGLFVPSVQPVELGARLRVTVGLPDDSRMEVEGVVVQAVGGPRPGFGVRFEAGNAMDLNLLEAMASSHVEVDRPEPEQRPWMLAATVRGFDNGHIESTLACELDARRVGTAAPAPRRGLQGPATPPPIPVDAGALRTAISAARPAAPPPPRSRTPEYFEEDVSFDTDDYAAVAPAAQKPRPAALRPRLASPSAAGPPIFGIDLGTTYSSIALIGAEGVQILADEDGNAMIPSVVCYTGAGSPPVVGWQARELLPVQRGSTFLSPKRLLGRAYDDPRVQPLLAASPVPMQRAPTGQVLATVHGQLLALPQVCAEIFRRLRVIGERATAIPVERVVLSAPVGYSPLERTAIERAAQLAGLEVMAMLDEPVAAAMAHGLGHTEGELIAIYDFGGGTFDCTVLEIRNERFKLLASGGDAWLGGDDFDLALAEHAANAFWREHAIDLRTRAVEWQRLVLLCERAKRTLTSEERVEVRARGIVQSPHGPLDLLLRFDRALLAELCGGLVERSVEEMDRCISAAGVRPAQVHHVVLTGGVSRMPLVRQHLQSYYQRETPLTPKPEQAIVLGNAIYARFLQLTGGKRASIDASADR